MVVGGGGPAHTGRMASQPQGWPPQQAAESLCGDPSLCALQAQQQPEGLEGVIVHGFQIPRSSVRSIPEELGQLSEKK